MHGKDRGAIESVLVTGGAGYVGSVLVPKLVRAGFQVTVLDLFLYGDHTLDSVKTHPALRILKGDIRDTTLLREAVRGCDAIIHLACISNDPSFELTPDLGKSINHDAFTPLVEIARDEGVRRFVYASSSSVYGVKADPDVTEDMELAPLTDYSRLKALCEEILLREQRRGFTVVILRPATVCGVSPRMRLDLTVNILTHHGVMDRRIRVFGGQQMRPNIHIEDMTDVYVHSLSWPVDVIAGQVFNVGYENYRILEIAEMVREVLDGNVEISVEPSNDARSYHISSQRIRDELGFVPRHTIIDAVRDMVVAFRQGTLTDTDNPRYYNVKMLAQSGLH